MPEEVQALALKNYQLWLANPQHPSLNYKRLAGAGHRFSVRVGNHYRAIAWKRDDGGVQWVWSAPMRSTIGCWGSVETRAAKRAWILSPGRGAGVGLALPRRRYLGWNEPSEVPAIRTGRDASRASSLALPHKE